MPKVCLRGRNCLFRPLNVRVQIRQLQPSHGAESQGENAGEIAG